jgi:hypothetical protein
MSPWRAPMVWCGRRLSEKQRDFPASARDRNLVLARCDVGRGASCRLARGCNRGDQTRCLFGRSQRPHGQAKQA